MITREDVDREIVRIMIDDGPDSHCDGHEVITDYVMTLLDAHTNPLIALLNESRRDHCHCDDSWYCCRACRGSDHILFDGEHLGKGHDGPGGDGRCTCGAAAWNARIDECLLKGIDVSVQQTDTKCSCGANTAVHEPHKSDCPQREML